MSWFEDVAARFFADSLVDEPVSDGDEYKSLTDLLPWRIYNPKKAIYMLDGGFGLLMEALPYHGGSDDFGRRIQTVLNHELPAGAVIQIINWASPDIGEELKDWKNIRQSSSPVASRMADERVKFIKEGRFSSKVRPIVLPHRRRVLLSVRLEGKADERRVDELHKWARLVESNFRDRGGSWFVKPEALIKFAREVLHIRRTDDESVGEYKKVEPIHHQFAGGGITVGNDQLRLEGEPSMSVCCGALERFPEQFNFNNGGMLNGVPDNPEMRPLGPVLTTLTVKPRANEKARNQATAKVAGLDHMISSGMAKFSRSAPDKKAEWERVAEDLGRGERLVDLSLTVCAYAANSEHRAKDAYDEMVKIYRGLDIELGDERFVNLPLFLNALPFGGTPAILKDLGSMCRVRVALSETAGFLAPVHGEWSGHRDPSGVLLFGRNGQTASWNPFLSPTNFNVAVSGRSGSGKSVFMQELATSLVSAGGRAIVVDDGRSFENTCNVLGGDFIAFDQAAKVSINPFSLIRPSAMDSDEVLGEDADASADGGAENYRSIALGAATSIGITIATDGDGVLDKFERQLIRNAVEKAWDKSGVDATYTDVRAYLLETGATDPRANDLAMMFERFCEGGELAGYFEGRSSLSIDSDFTVFELGEIKSNALLKSIVLQVIMFLGEQLMFNTDRSIKVGLILDEAWDLLRGDEMGRFIGGIARRARKHSGMLVTGTQSINDFYLNPAAQATVDNSDWVVILSQKAEAIDNLMKDNRLSVSDYLRQQLSSLKKHDNAFSEMAIRNADGGWAFMRLVLDPYSIAVYSSQGETVERIKRLEAEGYSLEDAIGVLVEQGAVR